MASILICEADPDVRRLLTVLMERLGHEAITLDRHVEAPPRGDLLLLEPLAPWCVEQARLVRMFFPEIPIVCMGQIPDGTGFWWYRHVQIPADEPPPPPPVQQPSDDELELDREMEYLVEPEEAEARGITEVE